MHTYIPTVHKVRVESYMMEHAYILTYIHICMYVCVYIYIYIHTYIHTYIHVYVHTYTHALTYQQGHLLHKLRVESYMVDYTDCRVKIHTCVCVHAPVDLSVHDTVVPRACTACIIGHVKYTTGAPGHMQHSHGRAGKHACCHHDCVGILKHCWHTRLLP